MHQSESALEKERHKILWDSEIQIDHSLPERKPDFVLIK